MARRIVCSWLIVCLLTSFFPARLFAQSFTAPDDPDAYASEVAERAALEQELERQRSEAIQRRRTIDQSIQRLRADSPPPGVDTRAWYRQRDERIKWLQDYLERNESNLQRYENNLDNVRSRLASDRKFIMTSDDPELKQALGSLVGVAGVAGIPVYSRPNVAALKASVGRSMMGMKLNATNKALVKAQARADVLAAKASSLHAPVKGNWVTEVGPNGNLQLRNGSQVKDLGVKAEIKSADGSPIKNNKAYRKAQYYTDIYTARSNLTHSIGKLRYERSVARNAKARKALDAKIQQLEAKKAELESDIARHDAENPKAGGTLKNLAVSAGKWALFSAGVTLTTRAFAELRQNNWDFRKINWRRVAAPLATTEFWGGTAGSFVGSMALSALVPGGAFVRTLAAVAGAAIGWQIGTGNLFETNWTELIASSLGATIGSLLGAALGPIGSLIGGFAGHYAAMWLLGKVREWLDPGIISYDPSKREKYEVDRNAEPFVPGTESALTRPDGIDPGQDYGNAADIRNRMMEIQSQMRGVMESRDADPYDRNLRIDALRREYGQLQRRLSGMRQSAAVEGYGRR